MKPYAIIIAGLLIANVAAALVGQWLWDAGIRLGGF